MGRYSASLDFGPQLHSIEHMLFAITQGFRAQPSKIPKSAFHYAVKVWIFGIHWFYICIGGFKAFQNEMQQYETIKYFINRL